MEYGQERRSRGGGTFAALSFPNYRIWFAGQMVSLLGTWMQTTAQGYLIYTITGNSPQFLGYVGFAGGIATWVFSLWGGVAADRVPRRGVLVVTQSLSMLLAFILAALNFAGVVAPWHIILLAFLLGVVNAFDAPARQAFVLELVDRGALTNAIALNSTMFNIAIVLGPAVGGFIYKLFGPAWCFAVNGVSFIAVIAALLSMKLAPFAPPSADRSAFRDMGEGLKTVLGSRLILAPILLIGIMSLFGMAFSTLIPAWAVQVLNGDVLTASFLQSARGLGAIVAALGIAAFVSLRYRGKVLTAASFIFPLMVLAFSFTRALPLSLGLLVCVGAANIVVNNLCNSLVQTLSPDPLRGRVMSVYILVFFGFMPIGALLAGILASALGEHLTVALTALLTLAGAAFIAVIAPGLKRLE
jgi:MFS family permease